MRTILRTAAMSTAAVLAFGVTANAQETLQFAHVYSEGEPYHQWAEWAADEIAERTDGRYAIEVFPSSQLGSEAQISEGMALGTIDMGYLGALFASNSYGPIAIAEAPYMLRDFDHWQAYVDSDLFEDHVEGYHGATGHMPVAATYYGARHVTSNIPINEPADMEGLRIRVPDAPLYTMFPRAVGASPTPIAFAEVYLSLQQGVVDAQENPLPTIYAQGFYEVQDYINLTGHIRNLLLTTISGNTWNSLSEEDQQIFAEVFAEAAASATQDVLGLEASLVSDFEEMGINVNEVDVEPFMDALRPLLLGDDATWSEEDFERMQALGQ